MKKLLCKIFGHKNKGQISDGYHTFDELYEHRVLLYLSLLKCSNLKTHWMRNYYPGWHVVFLELPTGQISYHVPAKHTLFLEKNFGELSSSIWDGHMSKDVVARLEEFLK